MSVDTLVHVTPIKKKKKKYKFSNRIIVIRVYRILYSRNPNRYIILFYSAVRRVDILSRTRFLSRYDIQKRDVGF